MSNQARLAPLLSMSVLLGGMIWYWNLIRRQTSACPVSSVVNKAVEPEVAKVASQKHELLDEGGQPHFVRQEPTPRLVRTHDPLPLKAPSFSRKDSGWTDGQDDAQDVLSLMCRTSIIREPASLARERPAPEEHEQKVEFHEVTIRFKNDTFNMEDSAVAAGLRHALALRKQYSQGYDLKLNDCRVEMRKGVMCLLNKAGILQLPAPSLATFAQDVHQLWMFAMDGPAKTTCFRRLALLSKMGELHTVINKDNEAKGTLHNSQDFYQVPKVDNHIHSSAMMGARHLLQFIVDKLDYEPNVIVMQKELEGVLKDYTLAEVFAQRGLNRENLSVDDLKVQGCCASMFHRFDRFNNSYNPFGDTVLRDLFLKTNNYLKGKYFAQLCNQVVDYLEVCDNNVYIEPRLSIYGETKEEWLRLAQWFHTHKLNRKYVLWMIQLPRVFHIYRKRGTLQTFEEYLSNVFTPMFEATLDPVGNPEIAEFLSCIVGIDSVDDESVEDHLSPGETTPDLYTSSTNPMYSYYLFYTWANLQSLNTLRKSRGLNVLSFRPHCGESGPVHHLATCFLLAQSINHGIHLRETPTLQYLYYLAEIGMSMSPLSNNVLFVELERNPFPMFFRQGLNVTLSTDDPLQFHTTREALVEEYTIARQLWRLSSTDLSEIARNSVMQSGLSYDAKLKLLGPRFLHIDDYNDPKYTNIPQCRIRHRLACKSNEHKFVWQASGETETVPLHWHELGSELL